MDASSLDVPPGHCDVLEPGGHRWLTGLAGFGLLRIS